MHISIPTEDPVLSDPSTSVSTNKDTKYLLLGFLLMAALRMRPVTWRLFTNFTNPILGSFI
ncbi:hypothetical protein OCF61_30315 [Bacillus cereus]|nr:hypothetical protein [Bacillus cereus]